MAKKGKDENMESKGNGASRVRAPRDMARVGSVANAPWFNLANGNTLYGKLINIFERPDERARSGKSKFFQVEVMEYIDGETGEVAPCQVRYGRGHDASMGIAEPGEVVNLNYGPKTKDLEPFVADILRGAEYTVFCTVNGDKFTISQGRTMWPVEVFATQTRAPKQLDEPDFDEDEDAPAAATSAENPAGIPA